MGRPWARCPHDQVVQPLGGGRQGRDGGADKRANRRIGSNRGACSPLPSARPRVWNAEKLDATSVRAVARSSVPWTARRRCRRASSLRSRADRARVRSPPRSSPGARAALLAAEPRVGAASPGKYAVKRGRKRAVLGNERPQHKGAGPGCAGQAVQKGVDRQIGEVTVGRAGRCKRVGPTPPPPARVVHGRRSRRIGKNPSNCRGCGV
jgi:hypothetical protein